MDECLTTVIAQEKLHAAGKKAKNFRPVIDQVAAVEILNTWLDSTLGAHFMVFQNIPDLGRFHNEVMFAKMPVRSQ